MKKQNDIEWLEFELLKTIPRLSHGVILRPGGVSEGAYQSLNLASHVGDCPIRVQENQQRVMNALQIPHLVYSNQVHGVAIADVKSPYKTPPEADVLISSHSHLALMIHHADCQVALFYDTKKRVIAAAHAGWRGSVQNIYEKTISHMKKQYNTHPKDILACISPSLGPDDAQFINYKTELPQSFWKYQVKPEYFDFWQISHDQLVEAGVPPHHIEIARINNKGDSRFFSYRRDKITGRNGTFIMLR